MPRTTAPLRTWRLSSRLGLAARAGPTAPSPHQIPAGDPGPWLFPGLHPGSPVLPATISHRLARIGVNTVTSRASALLQLAGELPPTVVADLLGLRPKTAVAWSQLAGRP